MLALMHESLVPPDEAPAEAGQRRPSGRPSTTWSRRCAQLGHEVRPLGVGGDLGVIRAAVEEFQPHIAFNLLEGFDDVPGWDANVVALPRAAEGPLHRLQLARPAAGARQVAHEEAALLPPHPGRGLRGLPARPARPAPLAAEVPADREVADARRLHRHLAGVGGGRRGRSWWSACASSTRAIGTDALVERYIEGRELYVGVLGNQRLQALPVWELLLRRRCRRTSARSRPSA